jgi:hypothetical protein
MIDCKRRAVDVVVEMSIVCLVAYVVSIDCKSIRKLRKSLVSVLHVLLETVNEFTMST